ncbi:MAG: hypothetical protein IKI66_04215 [Bacteroidales bacterium]|nr:hypothetical protein [Bacteroidales bacterium]
MTYKELLSLQIGALNDAAFNLQRRLESLSKEVGDAEVPLYNDSRKQSFFVMVQADEEVETSKVWPVKISIDL